MRTAVVAAIVLAVASTALAQRVRFETDAGMLLTQIKPDKTADFEAVMQVIRDAMRRSSSTVRQEQAKSLKVYRAAEPSGANAMYVIFMDPVVPRADYDFAAILKDSMPAAEMVKTMKRLNDCLAGKMNKLSLSTNFGAAPPQVPDR
jgi:hypothetical protein